MVLLVKRIYESTNHTTRGHEFMKGAVAAGHRLTCDTAADILRAGGNAFDAAIGGFFTACVTEPVLASLGGGGFLFARNQAGQNQVYDFFTHTPGQNCATTSCNDDIDFHPVSVDFGAVRQEFHIGLGACAVPGTVRGMFAIHRHLATLPLRELIQPAVELARGGVAVNPFQSYLLELVSPIYRTESALPLFQSPNHPGKLLQAEDVFYNPRLADVLETLSREGDAFFYQGEIATRIVEQCRQGGYLTRKDLKEYQVCQRAPLEIPYRDHRLLINPPPSAGGLLIGFGLELLKHVDFSGDRSSWGSEVHINALIETMQATSKARSRHFCDGPSAALLNPELLAQYRERVLGRAHASRGTTHISVIDAQANVASLTVSNGEGCGRLMADLGFMLNNMLGEEDVNPGAGNLAHRWQTNQRMSSMMAPGILLADDGSISALGSGGSNRIRTAILQVIGNTVDFAMDIKAAVAAPRVHIETDDLQREQNFPAATVRSLSRNFPGHRVFDKPNMFFGGVHVAQLNRRDGCDVWSAVGDPRRGGIGVVVE